MNHQLVATTGEVVGIEPQGLDPNDRDGDRLVVSRQQLRQFMAVFVEAASSPVIDETELAALWSQAFDEWLNTDRNGKPRPRATVNAYSAAWSDFRLCCPKSPWLVGPADVKRWIADMRGRAIDRAVAAGLITAGRRNTHIGLSEATQAQYLAAVSSFYSFCERYPLPDGRSLFEGVNPVKAKGVPRPQPKPFAEAAYLNVEQLRALLSAISTWAVSSPARNLQGLRDFALFTAYLLTGGRSSEIRVLQWKDLRLQAGSPYYHWENKGKSGWDELAVPAWEAIRTYLQLANRLSTITRDDYIFTPLSDAAARFGRIEDWHTNRPLSGHEVGRLLKKYGALAGLDPALLHVHTLRHSAYMLYTAAGSDVRFCSKLLHHSSLATTSRYDHIMAGQRNTEWAKAWSLLDLRPVGFVPGTLPDAKPTKR